MNYYKSKLRSSKGFTLIEVLTVIAIIAILSAILVPTVSQMQSTARKTKDLSNMRQIINSSQVFASQNGDLFPQAGHSISTIDGVGTLAYDSDSIASPKIGQVAAVLALEVGLNDVNIWISDSDPNPFKTSGPMPALVAGEMNTLLTNTTPAEEGNEDGKGYLSFNYVLGLTLATPSQTPIVFSRLENPATGGWGGNDMYDGKGGHIGFAGGNVSWFEGTTPFDRLFTPDGADATTMNDAIGVDGIIAGN